MPIWITELLQKFGSTKSNSKAAPGLGKQLQPAANRVNGVKSERQ